MKEKIIGVLDDKAIRTENIVTANIFNDVLIADSIEEDLSHWPKIIGDDIVITQNQGRESSDLLGFIIVGLTGGDERFSSKD